MRVIYLRKSRDAKRIIFDSSFYERSRVNEIIVSMVSRILWYIIVRTRIHTRTHTHIYIYIYIRQAKVFKPNDDVAVHLLISNAY